MAFALRSLCPGRRHAFLKNCGRFFNRKNLGEDTHHRSFILQPSVNLVVDYMGPVPNPTSASVKTAGMEGTAIKVSGANQNQLPSPETMLCQAFGEAGAMASSPSNLLFQPHLWQAVALSTTTFCPWWLLIWECGPVEWHELSKLEILA